MTIYSILLGSCLLITALAAMTDWRSGLIPNWLTIPPLVVGPLAHFLLDGVSGLLASLVAVAVCALVPYFMFKRRALGGGDVKLFAALGALGGVYVGLEAQFVSYFAAALFALAALTWRGRLFATLANSFSLAANPLLPKRWRRCVSPQLMTSMRMGAAIFVAMLVVALLRVPHLGI